jgi:glycerophosphoryl diester phosphodiesterase
MGEHEQVTRIFGHGPDAMINTLGSFELCRAQGADGVELDVRRTRDDRLVAIHDHALADGRAVADTRRADLPSFVPDLDAVLDECAGMTVNLEIKNYPRDPAFDPDQRVTQLVLELLASRDGTDDVLISCFDFACIDLVREAAPRTPTAMLYLSRRPPNELLESVVEHGHRIVHPYDTMVDRSFMDEAHARDLTVNVWLDAAAERMRTLVHLGVEGLITSDVDGALLAVTRERGAE